MTGYAPAPKTGVKPDSVVPVSTVQFNPSDLPLLVIFNGRGYLIRESTRGGLVMNGAPESLMESLMK
jgi:hypothetical protein